MTPLIRELVHFEEVEEVIKLRKDEKALEYVETYVISDSLRRSLLYMLELLSGPTHKSFNVVGNYGTGKSHFLCFITALLEHPDLRQRVQDEAVRAAAQALERRYMVVKFELGAAAEVSLRHIFFDQVRRQLLDNYGIDVRAFDPAVDYDNKQNVLRILADVKAEDPEAGLVVVVDELSDFLKQKNRQGMNYDLQLLRELGEVSQDSDFLYIGAMQEHVFTNPKYVEQAESIARINQRFVTVSITKDDVAQVLTRRVVRKDAGQRLQLESLLAEHRQYFPNLAQQMGRYIDLFPIHPYVIDVFERLPYFENRGIIGFAVNTVQSVMDVQAPRFITYDQVFDLINTTHEIRNQPDVARVVQVVQTLQAKVDLLDPRLRDDGLRLIKALAVLNLLGGEHKNGATSQELANTLLITPPGRLLVEPDMARDNVERIMDKIRSVTVGQYISHGAGRYYLDLSKIVDYDALIEQRAQAAVVNNPDEIDLAFRAIVESELGCKEQKPLLPASSIYADTAPWPSRHAFRPGTLAFGRRDAGANVIAGDYRFVLQGPVAGQESQRQDEAVLAVDFPDDLLAWLIRARAAELLAADNVHKKEMTRLSRDAAGEFQKGYLARLLAHGAVQYGGHRTQITNLPVQRGLNDLADVLEHLKGAVLDPAFAEKYPRYPVFRTLVTQANLSGEMLRALQALDRMATQQLDMNARGYLESFGLLQEGHFSTANSPACQLILQRVEENDAANQRTALDDLVRELDQPPWGLPVEMVYLLLGALLFHGYLLFIQQGGARLRAGDVGPMLKQNGLGMFENLRYVERDRDIDVEGVAALFEILGLQAGLVRQKEQRSEAVKALRIRGQELKAKLSGLRQAMQGIATEAAAFPDVPWLVLQGYLGRLAGLDKPLSTFADASRVTDLGKLDVSPESRQALAGCLADFDVLSGFAHDWCDEGVGLGLKRMQEALPVLVSLAPHCTPIEQATIAELQRTANEGRSIVADERQLLRPDLRRPLKGKLEQFHRKYNALYYTLHARVVGDDAAWGEAEGLRASPRYHSLNRLKGLPFISSTEFNQVALELQALERRRCHEFIPEVLDSFTTCPYCRFPEGSASLANLPALLSKTRERLDNLWERWQEHVFNELPGLAGRLPLLSAAHRRLIEDLQRAGSLPDLVPDDLLAALFELASELQPVELDLEALGQMCLAQGSALTVDELRQLWERYLSELLRHHEAHLVRFKIVLPGDKPV